MTTRIITLFFSAIIYVQVFCQNKNELWYRQPATKWTEALPIGNGRMAAMVFGKADTERIQLNEETIWAGCPVNDINPGAKAHLKEIQKLLFEGKNEEAYRLTKQHMLGVPPQIRSYQTLGDLFLDYGPGMVSNYRRSLDLSTAQAHTAFEKNKVQYEQTVFLSAPSDMLILRVKSSVKGQLQVGISLKREQDAISLARGNQIRMTGQIIDNDNPGLKGPAGDHLRFATLLEIQPVGGKTESIGDSLLRVTGADEIVVRLTAASDYDAVHMNFDRKVDPMKKCEGILAKSVSRNYEQLVQEHISEYHPAWQKLDFEIEGASGAYVPTDQRLELFRNNGNDYGLIALYFQYGRYLLLNSSRLPGSLPANLQGKWNPYFDAPWQSDYHTNINLQMNYWPADIANVPGTFIPLAAFMNALQAPGENCAKEMYGANGWVIHHVTDIYGRTAINADPIWGTSPLAGAWMTLNLFDHYTFSQDREFLLKQAYPLMRKSAQFILDFLVADPKGYLVTAPSMSPENGFFLPGDNKSRQVITYGPAIDVEIIHELFNAIRSVAGITHEDPAFLSKLESTQKRLPPIRVNSYGGIMEWIGDYEEQEPGHRHMSQLFGLYPGTSLTKDTALTKAARVTIEHRLANGGGHTGWSRAWMINFFARLKDGEQANFHLEQLLKRSTLPNLFDDHPPFQIDGNFGGTAGIAEMLLQSHMGAIEILPALPSSWSNGHIYGIKARGGFELDLEWKNNRLQSIKIRSLAGNQCHLDYQGKRVDVTIPKGGAVILDGKLETMK